MHTKRLKSKPYLHRFLDVYSTLEIPELVTRGLCHADWPFGVSDPSSVPSLGVQVAGGPEDERAGDIHEYPGGDGRSVYFKTGG